MNDRSASVGIPDDLGSVVFANAQEAILISDARGRIVDVNPAFTRITGYERDEAIGQTPRLLKSGYQDEHFYQSFWQALRTDGRWQGEIWNRRKDGSVYPEFLTVSAVPDGAGSVRHYIAIFYDIGFIKEQADRFKHLAHHDVLTGLPNRLALGLLLPQAIARARRQGTQLAVAMLDLDDFKPVNDSHGHKAGDDLLRILAQRLKDCLRGSDFVARVGGDEFVIVLKDLVREAEVYPCLERIRVAFDGPFLLPGGIEVSVGASLGWTLYPEDDPNGTDAPELLLRNADMALYVAKADKLHRLHWYHRWGQTTPSQLLATRPEAIGGYGEACERLLRLGAEAVGQASEHFVRSFYAELTQHGAHRRILESLDDDEAERLRRMQAEHLCWLLGTGLTPQAHRARAAHVGRVHALVGVRASALVHATGIYREQLVERIIAMPMRVVDRAGLIQVINIRLQVELQAQIEALEALQADYQGWLRHAGELAREAADAEALLGASLDALVRLPGMVAAAWGIGAAGARDAVRRHCGEYDALARALQRAGGDPIPPARGPAWPAWRAAAAAAGVRSAVVLPLQQDGAARGFVALYGAFPAQFDSPFMRDTLDTWAHLLHLGIELPPAEPQAEPASVLQRDA